MCTHKSRHLSGYFIVGHTVIEGYRRLPTYVLDYIVEKLEEDVTIFRSETSSSTKCRDFSILCTLMPKENDRRFNDHCMPDIKLCPVEVMLKMYWQAAI
jgi:hypothetical protein